MFKKILLTGIAFIAGVNLAFAANPLADTERNLVSYNNKQASGTLSFDQSKMYSKFCNNVSQSYTYTNNTITSDGIALSTMMYCEGLPMILEYNFDISTGWTQTLLSGDQLTITTTDKNTFIFTKQNTSDPVMCTMEYAPVCGEVEVQCIQAPCPPIKQTFGNSCMAGAAGAKNITQGECSSLPVVGWDTDEHGCKGSAGYTWNTGAQECVRSWEYETVLRAYNNGITKYNTMTSFMPNNYLTREQAAKMLMVTIDASGVEEWMIKQPAGGCKWTDKASINSTLYDQVFRSCTKWLFKGSNEGLFLPHQAITREHIAFVMKRLETFVPKIANHPYLTESNNTTPYTRLEFAQFLQQLSPVLEKAAEQDFTQQTKDLEAAKQLWKSKNITSYKMIQQRSCFCMGDYIRPMIYDVSKEIAQRGTARYNDNNKEQLSPTMDVELNSVTDAFSIIENAIKENVDSLTVEYDKTYGYPTKIAIDTNFMIADEEQYLSFTLVK